MSHEKNFPIPLVAYQVDHLEKMKFFKKIFGKFHYLQQMNSQNLRH